jgi:hypothetical protein
LVFPQQAATMIAVSLFLFLSVLAVVTGDLLLCASDGTCTPLPASLLLQAPTEMFNIYYLRSFSANAASYCTIPMQSSSPCMNFPSCSTTFSSLMNQNYCVKESYGTTVLITTAAGVGGLIVIVLCAWVFAIHKLQQSRKSEQMPLLEEN